MTALKNPAKAKILSGYFKTGPGEYGEGDVFWGLTVPVLRKLVKKHRELELGSILTLLQSSVHEQRLLSLLLLVHQYERGDAPTRASIYRAYLANTQRINNWDLVDLSADRIVGAHLDGKSLEPLFKLTRSKDLWERRIAMLSTFHFTKRKDPGPALEIAGLLVDDRHDLIHKAVGWMLREVGKRCSVKAEEAFLERHAATMPRTMLRYAIERFPEPARRRYLETRTSCRRTGRGC